MMKQPAANRQAAKPATCATMERAKRFAAALTDAERLTLMEPTELAANRMLDGQADERDWGTLAEALGMGIELIKRGICSDAQSVQVLVDGYYAIGEIGKRHPTTGHYQPQGQEADAIAEGLKRHALQLQFTTVNDLRQAFNRRQNAKARARAGRAPAITPMGVKHA